MVSKQSILCCVLGHGENGNSGITCGDLIQLCNNSFLMFYALQTGISGIGIKFGIEYNARRNLIGEIICFASNTLVIKDNITLPSKLIMVKDDCTF